MKIHDYEKTLNITNLFTNNITKTRLRSLKQNKRAW